MNPDPFWRHREFLAEAERDRLLMQIPRQPRRIRLRLRARMAQGLLAMATWLSPDIHHQATPALKLARVTRRNCNV